MKKRTRFAKLLVMLLLAASIFALTMKNKLALHMAIALTVGGVVAVITIAVIGALVLGSALYMWMETFGDPYK